MAGVIVGIHGLANKPAKPALTQWWEESIREGLENIGVPNADFQYIMVYWADLLYKYPQHDDQDLDFDSLYINQPYVRAAPGSLREYREGWFDNFRATVSEAAESALDAVAGTVGLDRAGEWLLREKVRDLFYYYDPNRQLRGRDGQRETARKVLMNELMSTLVPLKGQKVMVIAHSMGSIIAYDVLRDLGQDDPSFPVQHFVTIGSPLGLNQVKERVYVERAYSTIRLRTPTVVREKWRNYADRRDPVAIDTNLSNDYGPNDSGVRVEDDLIINDYVTPNYVIPPGESRPHKVYGYLRAPELSKQIREFLAA